MIQERNVNIDQFIKFNAGGIVVADYDQVKAALIKRYKDTYGYDIDLSNTTADGVFVNDLALIINNVLQSFKTLYGNLNVDTASGAYLDSLCRLSNVTRKRAIPSTAQLLITSSVDTMLYSGTLFIDTTGNEWVYNGNDIEILASADAYRIDVTCTQLGPIEAKANSITQTVEATYLNVAQLSDAAVGNNDETDEELRARRDKSRGAQGVTVLESLVGALLAVDGIEDVQIINNNSASSSTASDTTSIPAHSVYVVIRKSETVNITDDTIGNIIYNAMTPGISTTPFTGTNGIAGEYDVTLDPALSFISQTVYWKLATPIAPTVQVTLIKGRNYTSSTSTAIGDAIMTYLNHLSLSELISINDIIITATYADNTASYVISDVTVSDSSTNPNTYFKYSSFVVSIQDDVVTFTFS